MRFLKSLHDFKYKNLWKSMGLILFLFILFILTSSSPGLTLEKIESTDKSSAVIKEETFGDTIYNPNKYLARVKKVIDGDTLILENGEMVRYIGIDAPETIDDSKPIQCYGKEASAKNKELVEGKEVRLEKDVSETDSYGRLLRYVWLKDLLVNEYLIEEGYAQSISYPPDIKYQNLFLKAQKLTKEGERGLWGETCR